MNYKYSNLTPFKWCVIENFPFIEADFDAITNYQLFCKVVEYLNKTIDTTNVLGLKVQEFATYFENLDVQDEINKKLDDLVENGTLTELIEKYINPLIEEQNLLISGISRKVDNVVSGQPLIANSIEEMTNTNRIYVNTSNGHWYSYNGEEWIDGGEYLSNLTDLQNFNVLPNFLKIKTKNIFDSINWFENKTFTPNKNSNIFNLIDKLTDSSFGNISEVIQIKNKNGIPFIDNNYLIFNTLDITSPIFFEYDLNGNYLRTCDGSKKEFSADAYYVVFKQYFTFNNHWNLLVKDIKLDWLINNNTEFLFNYNYSNNLFDYMEFIENKNIYIREENNLSKLNIYNYTIPLIESSVASISKPIQIKNEEKILLDINNLIVDGKNTDAYLYYLFDKNGNCVGRLKGTDVFNISENIYYIIFIKYNNINNTVTIKSKKIKWLGENIYEVGVGKQYNNLMNLFKLLKNDKTEKTIYIYNGTYDIFEELGGENFINSIDTSISSSWDYWSTFVPENTKLIGIGNVKLIFNPTGENLTPQIAGFLSALNIRGNVSIENINIEASNCRYAIHDETGYKNLYNNMYHIFKNVNAKYTLGNIDAKPSGQAFGCGFEIGNNYLFDSCKFETTKTTIAPFSMHNRYINDNNDASNILIKNCIFISPNNKALRLINLHTGNIQAINIVKILNSYLNGNINIDNDSSDTTILNSYQLEILNGKYENIIFSNNMENNLQPNIYN